MSQPSYATPPTEEWQDLFVSWDGDMIDPMFHSDTGFTGPQGHSLTPDFHLSESVDSEQPYLVSGPPSLADGLPSLEYTVSAPPSILDGSSFGQVYCTSPSFDTSTTSPLVSQGDRRYFGSFDTYDNVLSPIECPQESPILDTRYERITDSLLTDGSFDSTTGNVFNPYVAGSSHTFSGLDVRASRMLNLGTWIDQPQIIEPIAEADEYNIESTPIPIPYPQLQDFDLVSTSYSQSEELEHHRRSKAVPIPQPSRRPASYNAAIVQSQWAQRVPPVLSVSPVAHRRPRSVTLSRSNSRTSARRGVATPSPTSEGFGWVSYHINTQTNRLAPTSTEGSQGRSARGRKKGLTAEQRSHAALMRIIGACGNCQKRKEKCDPGTPCRSCLEHYKGDLINHPCRDRVLSDQSSAFLSCGLGWHPTPRSLESFVSPNRLSSLSDDTYTIPLNFGFGPSLGMSVYALHIEDTGALVHEHVVYSWPPASSARSTPTHAVLPAVLTMDAMSTLTQTLDNHLSLLVSYHFRHFPLFCSPLQILRDVYVFFRSLPTGSSQSRTLRQALKLLVLVHVGGDITLPPPNSNLVLSQLVQDTMNMPDDLTPTPCFIRSQFGQVMPGLALSLMKEVLSSLEQLLLNRDCEDWPISLAVLIIVLMTIESIHYHAAKLPYHDSFDATRRTDSEEGHGVNEEGVKTLFAFYTACFAGCHARLRPDWEGEPTSPQRSSSPEDTFIESVRGSIKAANGGKYLTEKATQPRQNDDMGYFFDRLVARLLLLKS